MTRIVSGGCCQSTATSANATYFQLCMLVTVLFPKYPPGSYQDIVLIKVSVEEPGNRDCHRDWGHIRQILRQLTCGSCKDITLGWALRDDSSGLYSGCSVKG